MYGSKRRNFLARVNIDVYCCQGGFEYCYISTFPSSSLHVTDATWTSYPKLEKHSLEQGRKHRSFWWQNMNFWIAAVPGTSKCAGIQEQCTYCTLHLKRNRRKRQSHLLIGHLLWYEQYLNPYKNNSRASLLKIDCFFSFFLPTIYYILL